MGKEYRAKVFKSGNSVALRLPKAWGFSEGEEVDIVTLADGAFEVRRKIDDGALLESLYGSFSADFMADGRGDIEQEERDWSGPTDRRPSAA